MTGMWTAAPAEVPETPTSSRAHIQAVTWVCFRISQQPRRGMTGSGQRAREQTRLASPLGQPVTCQLSLHLLW